MNKRRIGLVLTGAAILAIGVSVGVYAALSMSKDATTGEFRVQAEGANLQLTTLHPVTLAPEPTAAWCQDTDLLPGDSFYCAVEAKNLGTGTTLNLTMLKTSHVNTDGKLLASKFIVTAKTLPLASNCAAETGVNVVSPSVLANTVAFDAARVLAPAASERYCLKFALMSTGVPFDSATGAVFQFTGTLQ